MNAQTSPKGTSSPAAGRLSNKSHEWYTPKWVMELVRQVMGNIDLDPCSCEEANKIVQAARIITKEQDGLLLPWDNEVPANIFINPPGPVRGDSSSKRNVINFWDKCCEQHPAVNIFWLGFSIEQLATMQDCDVYPLDFPTIILRKRINFVGAGDSATHSNYVTLLSEDDAMLERFYKIFGAIGRRVI